MAAEARDQMLNRLIFGEVEAAAEKGISVQLVPEAHRLSGGGLTRGANGAHTDLVCLPEVNRARVGQGGQAGVEQVAPPLGGFAHVAYDSHQRRYEEGTPSVC